MGGSASSAPYKPITNPYGSDINVPDMGAQQTANLNSINSKYSGVRDATRAGMQASGVGGTELNHALGQDYNNQAADIQAGNASLQKQDFNNRLQAMSTANGANYNKANSDFLNAKNQQDQQNSQVSGGVGTALSVAALIAMLA